MAVDGAMGYWGDIGIILFHDDVGGMDYWGDRGIFCDYAAPGSFGAVCWAGTWGG